MGALGFVITANFVAGVGLVILSIFIYGSKPEQLAQWRDAALDKLGGALGRAASCSRVPGGRRRRRRRPTTRKPSARAAARRRAAESADARRREGV